MPRSALVDRTELLELAQELGDLPADWHGSGSLAGSVLAAIVKHAPEQVEHSAETGSGRSTVLFSNLSPDHTVFSIDNANSVTAPRRHPRFRAGAVTWVLGPTQRTLPLYSFTHPLDVVLIDGPHGYPFPEMEYARLYPHLRFGSLLIVDDIHIPTIRHLFDFLAEDAMFEVLDVVTKTSFFRRTAEPAHATDGDGWWLQAYNTSRFPMALPDGSVVPGGETLRARILKPCPVCAEEVLVNARICRFCRHAFAG